LSLAGHEPPLCWTASRKREPLQRRSNKSSLLLSFKKEDASFSEEKEAKRLLCLRLPEAWMPCSDPVGRQAWIAHAAHYGGLRHGGDVPISRLENAVTPPEPGT
jgi:hypothetical protein